MINQSEHLFVDLIKRTVVWKDTNNTKDILKLLCLLLQIWRRDMLLC